MTFKELAEAILALPLEDQDKTVGVWPPTYCPATQFVVATEIGRSPENNPVILTGKPPAKE